MKIPKLEELKGNSCSSNGIRYRYPEYYDYLMEKYKDTDLTFSEKLYFDLNNISERPVCVVCGAPVAFVNVKTGYRECCSKKCSNANPKKTAKCKETCIERYGGVSPMSSEDVKDKVKQTCVERYGVENPLQNEEIKNRVFKTIEERYGGIGNASEILKERQHKTCIERYGTSCTSRVPEIMERIKKTNLERYGTEYSIASDEVRKKIEKSFMERFGARSPYANSEVREKISKTIFERYGVEWYIQTKECKDSFKNESKPNREFAELLESKGIVFEREFPLSHYNYDFKVGDVLIEIDPTPTHNTVYGIKGHTPMSSTYHKEKTECAENSGYHCIHVFDWDDKCLIIGMLLPKERIFARKCNIVDVCDGDAMEFLKANHLQGSCNGTVRAIGLEYDGELVELMTFGKPRYNKNYEYELLRLCTRVGTVVVGGAQRIFKHFVDSERPASVISYCDRSKFSGSVYEKLGFHCKRHSVPSCHWYRTKDNVHITDNLLRQKGYDKLFNADYGKGTSNNELMLEHGFVTVYDCGQDTWTWERIQ